MTIIRKLSWGFLIGIVLGLAGCYGPSPGLSPVISFTFPDDTTLPNLPSGGLVHIKGDATTGDSTNNPITSYQWTQTPANAGTFSSLSTLETTWRAPTLKSTDQPLNVTITLTVKSLKGGKAVKPVNLIVAPPSGANVTLDLTAMNAENPATINLPLIEVGTQLLIKGAATATDPINNPISVLWSVSPNTAATINGAANFSAVVIPTTPGPFTLTLTVTTFSGQTFQRSLALVAVAAGTIAATNPSLVWDFTNMNQPGSIQLPNAASGATLQLLGKTNSANPTDPITSFQWTAKTSDTRQLLGSFTSPTTFPSSWHAPVIPSTQSAEIVTLTLTMTTASGVTSSMPLTVVVLPQGTTL